MNHSPCRSIQVFSMGRPPSTATCADTSCAQNWNIWKDDLQSGWPCCLLHACWSAATVAQSLVLSLSPLSRILFNRWLLKHQKFESFQRSLLKPVNFLFSVFFPFTFSPGLFVICLFATPCSLLETHLLLAGSQWPSLLKVANPGNHGTILEIDGHFLESIDMSIAVLFSTSLILPTAWIHEIYYINASFEFF